MCSERRTLSDFQSGTSLPGRSVVSLAATTPCQLQLMYSVGSTASVPVTTTGSSLVVFKLLWLISLACSIVYISAFVLSLLPPSFRETKMKDNTLSLKIHALFLFTKVFDILFSSPVYNQVPLATIFLQIPRLQMCNNCFSKVHNLTVGLPKLILSCSVGTGVSIQHKNGLRADQLLSFLLVSR